MTLKRTVQFYNEQTGTIHIDIEQNSSLWNWTEQNRTVHIVNEQTVHIDI